MPVRQSGAGFGGGQFSGLTIWRERPSSQPASPSGGDKAPAQAKPFVDWSPALLSGGVEAWYDGSDSIVDTAGSISQISDKSTNDRHLTQSTGANQPALTNVNGLRAAQFFDAARVMATASWTLAQPFEVFLVVVQGASTDFGRTYQGSTGADDLGVIYFHKRQAALDLANLYAGSALVGTGKFFAASAAGLAYTKWAGASSAFGQNGETPVTQSNPGTAGIVSGLQISRNSASAENWSGTFCEMVVVSGTLSDVDRQKVEGYLAWKWGITLPSGHTYFSAPPPLSTSTTYTAPVSGGILFAGGATQSRTRAPVPTGGLVLAGTSLRSKTRVPVPAGGLQLGGASGTRRLAIRTATVSGGIQLGGSATTAPGSVRLAPVSGGIQLGGAATSVKVRKPAVSGGIVFSGVAPHKRVRVPTRSGGIVFAGAATLKKVKVALSSGGAQFGGAAATQVLSLWTAPLAAGGLEFQGTSPSSLVTAAIAGRQYVPSGGVQLGGRAAVVFDPADPWQNGIDTPEPADWDAVTPPAGSWAVQDLDGSTWTPTNEALTDEWAQTPPATGTWS